MISFPPTIVDNAIRVASGRVPGSRSFNAYGKLTTPGATTYTVVWADGVWKAPPQIGTTVTVSSTSTSDGVGGIGIRKLRVIYLDANLDMQEEDVIMNGITAVTMVDTVRFIQCAYMLEYGTSQKAVGTISIKDAITGQIYNEISVGEKRCTSSARMVPKGKRLIVTGMTASSMGDTTATRAVVNLAVSKFEGTDFIADSILIEVSSVTIQDGSIAIPFETPFVFTEGVVVANTCSVNKASIITTSWSGWIEEAT